MMTSSDRELLDRIIEQLRRIAEDELDVDPPDRPRNMLTNMLARAERACW